MSQGHIDVKCNTNLFSNFPVLANLIASLICLSKSHHCHEIIIIKKLNKRGDAKISENSNCCSYSVIVWVSVVLKRTVVGDWHFDNLTGSHLTLKMGSNHLLCNSNCCCLWCKLDNLKKIECKERRKTGNFETFQFDV